METQVTITLTLTREQLLSLLGNAPAVSAAPAAALPSATTATPAAPLSAPAPQPSMVQVPSQLAAPPAQVQAPPPLAAPPAQVQAPSPLPAVQPMQTPVQMPAQTAPQTYTVQQLGLAARPLMEQGRQQELLALMAEFGVPSIAALPEGSRADFAARLRAMGGQI